MADGPDKVRHVSQVELSRALSSLRTANPRRKPVPSPKDETIVPQYVIAQTNENSKRTPVSYTIAINSSSTDSLREGISSPVEKQLVTETVDNRESKPPAVGGTTSVPIVSSTRSPTNDYLSATLDSITEDQIEQIDLTASKDMNRRPSSSISSVGEGTSAPRPYVPQVSMGPPTDVSLSPVSPVRSRPLPLMPHLAATRDNIPRRRAHSMPPTGPGPTQMYELPIDMPPSLPRAVRRRPTSIKKRWRPSPGSVRQRGVMSPNKPRGTKEGHYQQSPTSTTVKRVEFRPFARRKKGSSSTSSLLHNSLRRPRPPVSYKSFLKRYNPQPQSQRVQSPPAQQPQPHQQAAPNENPGKKFQLGEWIDAHFEVLPRNNQPRRARTFPILPSEQRAFSQDRVELPGEPVPNSNPKTDGSAFRRFAGQGWRKAVIVSTSFGSIFTRKPPLRNGKRDNDKDGAGTREKAADVVIETTPGRTNRSEEQIPESVGEGTSGGVHMVDEIVEAEAMALPEGDIRAAT